MNDPSPRRTFLKTSAIAAGGALYGGLASKAASQEHQHEMPPLESMDGKSPRRLGTGDTDPPAGVRQVYDDFNRFVPSRGDDTDSDYYLGKLVPGFRSAADGPAPFITPDVEKLPWKIKNGVKEFELVAQPVVREFLPGYKMNVWGFNGSLPGPTIEVDQGDRIRIILHQ